MILRLSILLLFITTSLFANSLQDSTKVKTPQWNKFNFKAYGVINYYAFDWDTDPSRRNVFDTERINMYLYYNFNENIQFKTEIEFEHGGAGVTMELDKFEEFGEFELELEVGGEIKVDQLNILFKYKPWLNFRVGRVRLYIGNASKLDVSTDYFTGQRSSMESALLPNGWYENGIELSGDLGKNKHFSYNAYLVNGLSSVGFTSANWIKRGNQQRFETINAENLAISARLDYNLPNRGYIGVSAYHGGSNQNRPKPDLEHTKGGVTLGDFHFNVDQKKWRLNGMLLYGNLQNSDKISKANRNLSNALNVKRTPVAKNALGYYIEGGYDILTLLKKNTEKQFFLFGRYDFYDSMHKTTGIILDNPRWERSVITIGANYFITPQIVFKTHYAVNTIGVDMLDGFGNIIGNKERTFLLGMAFDLSTK